MTNQNGKSSNVKIMTAFIVAAALSVVLGAVSVFALISASAPLWVIIIVSLITAASFVFAVVSAFVLSKGGSGKVEEISRRISLFANGDTSVSFRTNESSDIGRLSNNIADVTEALSSVIYDIDAVSQKVRNGDMDISVDTGVYPKAFRKIAENINFIVTELSNETKNVIDAVKDGSGTSFNFKGEKSVYNEILTNSKGGSQFIEDIKSIFKDACEGDYSRRIDESKYSGEYRAFAEMTNKLLESVDVPVREIMDVLYELSHSHNFNVSVMGDYDGIFSDIKYEVNNFIEIIGKWIEEFTNVFTEISKKNLDIKISGAYKGDLEYIKNYIELMISDFNSIFVDIESASKKISTESINIADVSNKLSTKTYMQAEAINRLNIGISKLSQQSVENEKSTLAANKIAITAKEKASIGNEQMNEMLSSMSAINEASNSISNIIKVIEDIAFQTNLLALNAAVEAARAGEHGKGFAVVADEVRTLASRSQQAAKETTELIETSIEKIEDGASIANNTAESLADIIEKINEVSNIISTASKISSEQADEIKHLGEQVNEIDNIARDISSISESVLLSNSLEKNAGSLKLMISDFKIKPKDIIERNKKTLEENMKRSAEAKGKGSDVQETKDKKPDVKPPKREAIKSFDNVKSDKVRNDNLDMTKRNKIRKMEEFKTKSSTENKGRDDFFDNSTINSQDGVKHFDGTSGKDLADSIEVLTANVPKVTAPAGNEIPVIDFDKTTDFGKY